MSSITVEKNCSLQTAVTNNEIEPVILLIDGGADVNSVSTQDGSTVLHNTVRKGHQEVARLLINGGAGPNILEKRYDTTAPPIASNIGHQECCDC